MLTEPILLDSRASKRSLWRLTEANRCEQAYAWKYGIERSPDGVYVPKQGMSSDALSRGTLIHIGVAHFNARKRALQQGQDPKAYYNPLKAVELAAARKGLDEYVLECKEAVAAYAEENADDPDEIIAVEEVIDVELVLPSGQLYAYQQTPDHISRRAGRYKIHDLKTTAKAGAEAVSQYAMTIQMLSYQVIGPMLFGDAFDGVTLDVLAWTGPTLRRAAITPAPEMVSRFPQIIQDAEDKIDRLIDSGRPVDNWPRAANAENCLHRYGKCDFWERCAWGAESELVVLRRKKVPVKLTWL